MSSNAENMHHQRRWSRGSLWAWALVLAGGVLFSLSAGYLTYGKIAAQRLDNLIQSLQAPGPSTDLKAGPETLNGLGNANPGVPAGGSNDAPSPSTAGAYPGSMVPFSGWAEPWLAEAPLDDYSDLVQGFLPLSRGSLGGLGTMPAATRIVIPSIDVDAAVEDLALLDLGNALAYETPNKVVGHIPTTGAPGEVSEGWYFGHLQSPIRDEGSVFRDLPLIPDLLRKGERVFIILKSPQNSYLYEVFPDTVSLIPKDDLRITDAGDGVITLVTCYPEWTYDHRLIVTGRLVGSKPLF
ncbi:MAG: class E sortase [Chloroflexi bacterium]|nr:class E sortase [Chloroflexota bacterium]